MKRYHTEKHHHAFKLALPAWMSGLIIGFSCLKLLSGWWWLLFW